MAAGGHIARVDLDTDRMADEEDLVAVLDLEAIGNVGRVRPGDGRRRERQGGKQGDERRKQRAHETNGGLHIECLRWVVGGGLRRAVIAAAPALAVCRNASCCSCAPRGNVSFWAVVPQGSPPASPSKAGGRPSTKLATPSPKSDRPNDSIISAFDS